MGLGKIENCVTADFEIVTPMFLGGADQQAEHIRPASFKGVLRFWWRAVNWGRFRKGASDDATALRKLHQQEAQLFGAAAAEENGKKVGGQGYFLMSVTKDATKENLKIGEQQDAPTAYLLGMGLYDFKKKLLHNAISGSFTISLRFRASTKQEDRASVIEALTVLGLLGGLGSRTRRGMGSIQLTKLEGVDSFTIPQDLPAYKTTLNDLITKSSDVHPPFTAFSQKARWSFLHQPSEDKVLSALGSEFGLYRGFGNKGNGTEHKTFGKKAEQNFKTDHDQMYQAASRQPFTDHPKRLIFGMPHNYFFSSSKKKVDIQNTKAKLERRASPLFMHVHKLGNEYIGVALMLPAQFLPKDVKWPPPSRQSCIEFKIVSRCLQRDDAASFWGVCVCVCVMFAAGRRCLVLGVFALFQAQGFLFNPNLFFNSSFSLPNSRFSLFNRNFSFNLITQSGFSNQVKSRSASSPHAIVAYWVLIVTAKSVVAVYLSTIFAPPPCPVRYTWSGVR